MKRKKKRDVIVANEMQLYIHIMAFVAKFSAFFLKRKQKSRKKIVHTNKQKIHTHKMKIYDNLYIYIKIVVKNEPLW